MTPHRTARRGARTILLVSLALALGACSEETRSKAKDKAAAAAGQAAELGRSAATAGKEAAAAGKEAAGEALAAGKEAAAAGKEMAGEALAAGKEAAGEALAAGQEAAGEALAAGKEALARGEGATADSAARWSAVASAVKAELAKVVKQKTDYDLVVSADPINDADAKAFDAQVAAMPHVQVGGVTVGYQEDGDRSLRGATWAHHFRATWATGGKKIGVSYYSQGAFDLQAFARLLDKLVPAVEKHI